MRDRVVYVSVDLDNRTDSGWMMESMLEIFDEHYSRQVSADTLRSMVKNARDGYYNGGRVPFGYTAVQDGKRKRLTIVEREAQVIRDIFSLYMDGNLRGVESKLKKLFEILELHGKDAPNMADLTERLRELKRQRNELDLQLAALEEEEIPVLPVNDDDVQEMADLLRDIVTTTNDQKKLRLFFSSFIDQIVVNDRGIRIEYRAEKLVNRTGFDTVRSKTQWLPDQGSNLGPAD